MKPNEFFFGSEDVKKGLDKEFVNYLMDLSHKLNDGFLDIRVVNEDLGAVVVYYFKRYWDEKIDCDKFAPTDENRIVVDRVDFPDGHYDYFEDEELKKEVIEEFLRNNPNYEYNWKYNYFRKKE